MKLCEAEAWLKNNRSAAEALLQIERARDAHNRLLGSKPEMWGPSVYEDWTHEELVWRIIHLQCVIRRVER